VGRAHKAARRSAAIGASAAGAFALFGVVLPQLVSTFNPTKLATALVTVAAALVTAAGNRWIELSKQRRVLESSLRMWPPERLGEADPATLGVYPPRGPDGNPEPYRARPQEDEALAQALSGTADIVVVHGPARAGKSRAAAEAVARKLPAVPAIVPVDPEALQSLADSGVRLNGPEERVCLWLDGLDRFMEVLDPRVNESLEALAGDVKVVATIRTEQWAEFLDGTGQCSEAARALDDAAAVVELGPQPGKSAAGAPGAAPTASDGPPVVGPVWRDRWLGVLGALLLGVAVLAVGFAQAGELSAPPPLSDQMEAIKRDALRGDGGERRHIVVDARARLHPGEDDSWILVLEDRPNHDLFYAAAANGVGRPPRSDELRIYDVSGSRLHLKLRFQPKGTAAAAAEWRSLSGDGPFAMDYDQDGSAEVIAGYAIAHEAQEAAVPFAIDWQDGRYQLVSLTRARPELASRGLKPVDVEYRREAYQEPRLFANALPDPRFRRVLLAGYRVQSFALVQTPRPRILTGYFVRFPGSAKPRVLELHANQLRAGSPALAPCRPDYPACRAPEREQDVIVPPDRTPAGAMLEAWRQVGDRWVAPVRVVER
jgi:hypothetical protein